MTKEMTEMLEFRRGGKLAMKNYMQIEEDRIKIALSYNYYLEIALQIFGTSSGHIGEGNIAAIKVIRDKKYRTVISKHGSETVHIENNPSFNLWFKVDMALPSPS
jgi:hypothetical protein